VEGRENKQTHTKKPPNPQKKNLETKTPKPPKSLSMKNIDNFLLNSTYNTGFP